ncbi:MAG: cytochrome C oxidase subunit IV [Gammaproteobacteria bacterium]|nr:cytochrome C oxidase subunit IV family protein [Gammaproteobacteria bacterium]MXW08038.1 cytochrome C oxidase subunit IV [Gammaproteobacteria bacterium]MYC25263.1 cytochrome C oxidase subunit IV [Gammaproteobacteria bacterium]
MATEGQQHPIKIYFLIWLLLFVFSFFSYLVDYLDLQGNLRWFLIVVFMLLKAGFIVAIFMHMKWERFALIFGILLPPIALVVLMFLMAIESNYAWNTRVWYMGEDMAPKPKPPEHLHHGESEEETHY